MDKAKTFAIQTFIIGLLNTLVGSIGVYLYHRRLNENKVDKK